MPQPSRLAVTATGEKSPASAQIQVGRFTTCRSSRSGLRVMFVSGTRMRSYANSARIRGESAPSTSGTSPVSTQKGMLLHDIRSRMSGSLGFCTAPHHMPFPASSLLKSS
ncbi:hypothetical protein FNX48_003790 [Streptomyces sp. IF17]|uniref:Uncharacterized protein n=1 Tax=Streptomyces alkaliphilus TaxID=1472722 RepID=A0A646I6E9_9ACTN|nr:hypothetical protein [Streptomyces alkaliphilus]